MRNILIFLMLCISSGFATLSNADSEINEAYLINPGDTLRISVWKEEDLIEEVTVRPDGQITFPLIGEAAAAGKSVESLRKLIAVKLSKYIPDPLVTISVRQLSGNKIYVIGKVNRPGEFQIAQHIDVMQALSLAGGTSTYASVNKIKILRRKNGKLKAIRFEYGDVEKGKNLEQNIILKSGDVVVVP